uniref:C1q domain-containing protein n=1 Tax=Electrophorus electricus TaxID=8005 RepID=A0A4W4FRB0_ELEEL
KKSFGSEPGKSGSPGRDGEPGAMGPPGLKGQSGSPGIGIPGKPGENGAPGDTGPVGSPGVTGQKGEPGAKGPTGYTGATGPMGPTGAQGPRGFQGERGATGEKGVPGTPMSAFTVSILTPYPPSGTPIKFDHIVYNSDHHYDPETGLFTCQVPGIYYFSYSMHVNGANALVALYKNSDPVMFTYDEYNKGFLDQMSGSVVLHLNEQDTVYVQVPDDEANGVFAADNVHCSFSGFLITN